MKVTFITSRSKRLHLNLPIGRFKNGRVINLNPVIAFRDYKFTTEDSWEIEQMREWMEKHPKDEIREIKDNTGTPGESQSKEEEE